MISKNISDIYICISKLFSQFGCYNIDDFYSVYHGSVTKNCNDMNILLTKYFHPYKHTFTNGKLAILVKILVQENLINFTSVKQTKYNI